MSDKSGRARFTDLPAGTYEVRVAAGGYEGGSMSVEIKSEKDNALIITLKKFKSENELFDVGVQVVDDATSNSLSGVQVTIASAGSQTTDAAGIVHFTNVPEGMIQAQVTAKGYQGGSYTFEIGPKLENDFTVILKGEKKSFGVGVVVMDEKENPISGAQVGIPVAGSKTTDADGIAYFTNVPGGSYEAQVTARGYKGISYNLEISPELENNFVVFLKSAQEVGGLTAWIVDNNERGISGAQVAIPDGGRQTTDAVGIACFTNVPAGNYEVQVTAKGYKGGNYNLEIIPDQENSLTIKLEAAQKEVPPPSPTNNVTSLSGAGQWYDDDGKSGPVSIAIDVANGSFNLQFSGSGEGWWVKGNGQGRYDGDGENGSLDGTVQVSGAVYVGEEFGWQEAASQGGVRATLSRSVVSGSMGTGSFKISVQ